MRSSRWGGMLRRVTVASTLGWGLACMLPFPHDDDEDVIVEEDDDFTEPDSTTLEGTWRGAFECPTATGAIWLILARAESEIAGQAFVETFGEPGALEFEVVVEGGDTDEAVRDLVVEAPGCEDCPVFEDVLWDLEVLPAVIDGDLVDLVPDEVCGFVLDKTR